ncbi:hypothetical protein DTO013E5_8280 [Penicillium roqueforti]|uniref:Type 1 phosphatases regulator n=1 Tax=Penicillium roqueforti (strain FM164) TaxID=1365484 RepID=W6Q207_PENRF|nr:uncharacterized protein LCP9604111_8916 [Penicillium roqueforti]CDM30021.1 Protein phosphatase inhibitor [Penicillium roqueforti FM164]KAF9240152.1 hypothetical protein LCP9604111_8916 [Penicillium roqueforti]KAI1831902.1 hypothetical protein CBS147337_7348 [Penicillium roqueforti]KAI2670594.1 hypothetical protein CBS147355_9125 [Penicillium roqueforti]KAI2677619.1 hypothetical protein LCP963914a_7911 [Penicillium roqueforti]
MSRTRQPIASNSFQTTTESSDSSTAHFPPTLRLRAEEATDTSEATSSSRRIRWSEDVIDNEGMGKKSSKVCCIYHKARPVGESSSEESSSSSSESESESEDDRRTARVNRARRAHPHSGDREPHDEHEGCCPEDHGSKPKRSRRKPSPNAYEKMPKPSKSQSQNQNENQARGT